MFPQHHRAQVILFLAHVFGQVVSSELHSGIAADWPIHCAQDWDVCHWFSSTFATTFTNIFLCLRTIYLFSYVHACLPQKLLDLSSYYIHEYAGSSLLASDGSSFLHQLQSLTQGYRHAHVDPPRIGRQTLLGAGTTWMLGVILCCAHTH